jgi:hypothetical protein
VTDRKHGSPPLVGILLVEDEEAHAGPVARASGASSRPTTVHVAPGIVAARKTIAAEAPLRPREGGDDRQPPVHCADTASPPREDRGSEPGKGLTSALEIPADPPEAP